MREARGLAAIVLLTAATMMGCSDAQAPSEGVDEQDVILDSGLNTGLQDTLAELGFTGNIQATLTTRLGRQLNPALADLGRLLWFDKAGGLHDDNTCGGCHSPSNGFGDTQSIEPVLARLDPIRATPIGLTTKEIDDLTEFVRGGLLDPNASPAQLCPLRPASVPSGIGVMQFESCP